MEHSATPEVKKAKNTLGTAGFVLAIIGLVFCWVPVLGWIVWALGLIFSLIGVFRTPRVLAIIGLGLSCLGIILITTIVGAIAASM